MITERTVRMNTHKNARLTVHSRHLICTRVLDAGLPPGDVATSFGVSLRTVHKWLARYRDEGFTGLENRSSRPRHLPHRLPYRLIDQILRLRRACRMTARQIAEKLGLARSTVARHLKAYGVGQIRRLCPREPVRRYERKTAGELVHLDIKKFNRFWTPGHRITHNRRGKNTGAGWEYVHVAIDDFSRLAYVEVLANEKGQTCAGFLSRAVAWFRKQGITVQRVMTDNGVGYISRIFAATCQALKARHLRTRPYTPKTNGKAERFIKTLIHEWAYARLYQSSVERAQRLKHWIRHYNYKRPHASLNYQPPVSRQPVL